jgi:hypothetical protein
VGQKVIIGDGSGVLTLWERGIWDDQDERIVLDRAMDEGAGDSVECLANVPKDIVKNNKMLAAGMGGGLITLVQLGPNKVVDVFRHDEIDAAIALGFDIGNRMISGGGQIVKVWQEKMDLLEGDSDDDSAGVKVTNGIDKRLLDSDSSMSDENSSEDGEPKRTIPKEKRRKDNSSQSVSGSAMGSFNGLD